MSQYRDKRGILQVGEGVKMTVEQFKGELCDRMTRWLSQCYNQEATYKLTADEINRMTGGAFFRAIEKLDPNYEWPE